MIDKPDVMGHGGNTSTGNVVKALLTSNHRTILSSFISSTELRERIDRLILNLAVILAVVSSSREVKIEVYEHFCKETALIAKSIRNENNIAWIKFTPTVHALLAHSSELIRDNESKGLHNFTEKGLESK